jgi:hypothetical protein
VEVISSTLSLNRAYAGGGGISNGATGTVTVTQSTLSGNWSYWGGGGIVNYEQGTVEVENSTLSGNEAVSSEKGGGGISNEGTGTVDLTYATIYGNRAASGGGIRNVGGTVRLYGSIVANGQTGGNCAGTIMSGGHNLFSDGTCSPIFETDIITTNHLLDPLRDNGGPTWTHALRPGSPAIDIKEDHRPRPSANDQRGQRGPVDGDGDGELANDVGAFELQLDGRLEAGEGGTVQDIAGTGAAFYVAPGVLVEDTNVVIRASSFSRPGDFPGRETEFVTFYLDPEPAFSTGTAASVWLPLLPGDEPMFLSLFVYDAEARTLVDTGIDGDVWDGTAGFLQVTQFPILVGCRDPAGAINDRLNLDQVQRSYDPTPVPNAPEGVYTISATFRNISSVTLRDLFFEAAVLTGGNVVLNAYGGPEGEGAVIPVPSANLGDDGTLAPGGSFTVDFEIGLATLQPFSFYVDAYGVSVEGGGDDLSLSGDGDADGFRFEMEEHHLQPNQKHRR